MNASAAEFVPDATYRDCVPLPREPVYLCSQRARMSRLTTISLVAQALDRAQARGDLGRIDGGRHADDQAGGGDLQHRQEVDVDRQPVDVIDVRWDADPVGIGEQAGAEAEVDT